MNPLGAEVSVALQNWNIRTSAIPAVGVHVKVFPSPWGSKEYSIITSNRERVIWINDYKDQCFVEIRIEDRSKTPHHKQKFHYLISDGARVIEDMARFLSEGTVPPLSPAKKLYVDWLNTPESADRKALLVKKAEIRAAGPAKATKQESMSGQVPVNKVSIPATAEPTTSAPWKTILVNMRDQVAKQA